MEMWPEFIPYVPKSPEDKFRGGNAITGRGLYALAERIRSDVSVVLPDKSEGGDGRLIEVWSAIEKAGMDWNYISAVAERLDPLAFDLLLDTHPHFFKLDDDSTVESF